VRARAIVHQCVAGAGVKGWHVVVFGSKSHGPEYEKKGSPEGEKEARDLESLAEARIGHQQRSPLCTILKPSSIEGKKEHFILLTVQVSRGRFGPERPGREG
jgi:hypothetical protein